MSDTIAPNYELLAFRLEQAEETIHALQHHVDKVESYIAERDAKRAAQERRQLVAGIMFLGSVIFTLCGVIWSYRSVIFKGDL